MQETATKDYRHQLRKLYHGVVLMEISLQVQVYQPAEGRHVRYTVPAWKELFRVMFHPEQSSEDLDDEEFLTVIRQVEFFAASELGVSFPPRENDPRGGAR